MSLKILLLCVFSIVVPKIACDTCDTYVHPQYGLGTCVETSQCPNALYVSGFCESKPSTVKCCFSLGGSSGGISCSSPTQKLSHATALSHIRNAGLSISSSGGCSDRNNPTCTSLEQINCKSISEIIKYKTSSGCTTIITGGTEVGHSSGTYSHYNGYKIDIGLNTCHSNYIKGRFTYAGKRGDGAEMWKDSRGNIFALEGDHWDILF